MGMCQVQFKSTSLGSQIYPSDFLLQATETDVFLLEGKRFHKKLCVNNHQQMLNSEGERRSTPQPQINLGNTKRDIWTSVWRDTVRHSGAFLPVMNSVMPLL